MTVENVLELFQSRKIEVADVLRATIRKFFAKFQGKVIQISRKSSFTNRLNLGGG